MADAGTVENRLSGFWELPPEQIEPVLLDAIVASHAWHFERNAEGFLNGFAISDFHGFNDML